MISIRSRARGKDRPLLLSFIVRSGVQALVVVALAVVLDKPDLGRFYALTASTTLLLAITSLGSFPISVRDASHVESEEPSGTAELLGAGVVTQTAAGVALAFPVALLVGYLVPQLPLQLTLPSLLSNVLLNAVCTTSYAVALGKRIVGEAALVDLTRTSAAIPMLLLLLGRRPWPLKVVVWWQATGNLAVFFIILLGLMWRGKIIAPNLVMLRNRLLEGWRHSVGTLAESANASSDQLLFERSGHATSLGGYSILVRAMFFAQLVPAAALDAQAADQIESGSRLDLGYRRALRLTLVGRSIIFGVFSAAIGVCVCLFFDLASPRSCLTISALLIAALCVSIQSRISGLALVGVGYAGRRSLAVVVGMIVNVGLNLMVIPLWGANGAAATTLGTELLVCALLGLWLKLATVSRQHHLKGDLPARHPVNGCGVDDLRKVGLDSAFQDPRVSDGSYASVGDGVMSAVVMTGHVGTRKEAGPEVGLEH